MSLPRLLCSLLVGSPYLLVTIILLVKGCRSRTQGQVQVVAPMSRVHAVAGGDVILPCFLNPTMNAANHTVEWLRPDLKPKEAHCYRDHRDSEEDQNPSYKRRTSLFHEELKNGNVSLKLTGVTLSDAGSYTCFIPTVSRTQRPVVQLLVGPGSQPVLSIEGTNGSGLVLRCESEGWYPEPELEWLDNNGTILPAAGPTETETDTEGFFTVRRNVTIQQTDNNWFTCRVQQQNTFRTKQIRIPDDIFPKPCQFYWTVGLCLAVAAVAAAMGYVVGNRLAKRQCVTGDLDFQDLSVPLNGNPSKELN
ncbi:putative selection and upkeep of intraepithelial T-cells protein 1 homolog isoform X2 [Oncorhynchus tshawytscha]|uniref:Ig-like domain-containing protein n=1 Tax=Oncorhynchus tshawytscha TaxID=74940 RepID=A0AAZ3QK12_ONCTS|nr:putative selection and upkeep of intraepithelial T-cells protein 1 homolog isoform X2 [Oncorhynchus tshawytscha]